MNKAAHNSTFAIGGNSCSADNFVVVVSFMIRINISGKKARPSQICKALWPIAQNEVAQDNYVIIRA